MADGQTANSDEWERKQVDDCRNCTPRSARELGTGRPHFRRNSRQIVHTLGGYMSTNCLPILLPVPVSDEDRQQNRMYLTSPHSTPTDREVLLSSDCSSIDPMPIA